MDFFIEISKPFTGNFSIINIDAKQRVSSIGRDILYIIDSKNHITIDCFDTAEQMALIIGDPIFHGPKEDYNISLLKNDFGVFVRGVDGFYYLIGFDKIRQTLTLSSSLFNILPIFYSVKDDFIIASSSFELVFKSIKHGIVSFDKQYYIEKALFNYPFLDRTPIEQIKSVPSNSLMIIGQNLKFEKHTTIANYFVDNPKPWRRSLGHLSDLFIQTAKDFIPDQRFCATLTGGLDGRTVVSLSISLKKDFYTYSYGDESSNDITIPRHISNSLGIDYRPFIIDDKYADQFFWDYGIDFLIRTYGLGNISRSHYAYASQNVLNDTNFLLSGNFGSEIIRAMKVPGVMTSSFLFDLFVINSKDNIISLINSYPSTGYLSDNLVRQEKDQLIDKIHLYFSNLPSELTTNQRFYIYLYENVFPKYFGPEIIYQRNFFNHRAPFLNFTFISDLLKTEVAGANSDFKETNPLKRYHGQVLYSHIINKTTPDLLKYKLDKNYSPQNFLTPLGPLKIGLGFLKKKLKSSKTADSPNYSNNNLLKNKDRLRDFSFSHDMFNVDEINRFVNQKELVDPMHITNIVSAALYFNKLRENV